MQRVKHQHICGIHEHHPLRDGQHCLVLELLNQGTLAHKMQSPDRCLPELQVVAMALQILSALAFMHRRDVIHRDIKPANIMRTQASGELLYKLIDLSISAVERDARTGVSNTLRTDTTSLDAMAGTAHCESQALVPNTCLCSLKLALFADMSPEQVREGVCVTAQTDLWSLGVVMFQALSGTLPFAPEERDKFKIARAIENDKAAPELPSGSSASMATFVAKALQKDISTRHQTAHEMQHALLHREPLNAPGRWDAMISYTQRNPVSEALAHAIHGELTRRDMTVWLDVKMAKRDEGAMEEGVKNSRCVIAIVSGPQEGKGEETAYFKRPFCLKELRWAVEVGIHIQPVVAAEDKDKITEFFADIPSDLQHLKSANWEHIDRKDKDYFELGVTKICQAAGLVE
eukprot:COSAG04_NODE_1540_length_6420_cov_3.248220_4_plen_404_part_00